MKSQEGSDLTSQNISPITGILPELQRRQYHAVHRQSSSTGAIPMPRAHVPRTMSEIQLGESETAAEWRDLCMFYRITQGIRDRQQEILQHEVQYENNGHYYEEQYGALPAPVDENSSRSSITSRRMVVHHVPPIYDWHHEEQAPTNSGYLPQVGDAAPSSSTTAEVSDNSWSLSGYRRQEQVIQFPILGDIRTLGRENSSRAAHSVSIRRGYRKNIVKQESQDSTSSEEDCAFSMDDI